VTSEGQGTPRAGCALLFLKLGLFVLMPVLVLLADCSWG